MPKFTVLIIEDEKNIQTFVGKILKKQDYRVLYADCGKEGLNLIHSQCPDVIILDLGLPDMNGNDIIQEVRTWTSTPIIVISARSAEKEKVLALDQGADDYITKPFGTSELLARILKTQQPLIYYRFSLYPALSLRRSGIGFFQTGTDLRQTAGSSDPY